MEMQERYEILAANGCRNLQEFNRRVQDAVPLKTPRRKDVRSRTLYIAVGFCRTSS